MSKGHDLSYSLRVHYLDSAGHANPGSEEITSGTACASECGGPSISGAELFNSCNELWCAGNDLATLHSDAPRARDAIGIGSTRSLINP